jgi:ABC-type branched-subunit amino acid transport system ATPase component/ABC-type branched-subunit amino acid transport system permease subunit
MEIVFLAQQVVNGLVLGGYYLLIALGLSLIFSVGGVVNLAHGAFYALGAYASVEIGKRLGFGPAGVLSPAVVGLLGIVFERFILRRFYAEDPILGLLVTFGLAMAAEQAIRMIWGAAPLLVSLPQALKGSVIVGDFLFSRYRLILLGVVAVILCGIWLLLNKTSFGRVVRAGIQRPDMVAALGIRLQPYMTTIVMLGVGMAALAGALFAPITIVHPAMGDGRGDHHGGVRGGGDRGPRQLLGRGAGGAAGGRGTRRHHPFRAGCGRGLDVRADVPRLAPAATRAARRAHREVRGMSRGMTTPALVRYRPLLIGAAGLVLLPLVMPILGLTVSTAGVVVILSIAALGLNMMMGFCGLVSFGHSAWFGIGAYAAALAQRHLLPEQIILPTLLAMLLIAVLSAVVGALLLRRRGVYFALMTLALAALTYTVAFRWTAVTGGEDGLAGLKRGSLGPVSLDDPVAYYAFVALVAFGVLYALLRAIRSPFGHVLVAIRENQLRATFQGYPVDRYKLAVFVLSATVTALAGALSGFQHYIVTAETVSVAFSGQLLAMVVIGGMHSVLGPALGVVFYILFREVSSIWTADWLFWFGLTFVSFVLFSPSGLVGVWERLSRRWRPRPKESAAMSRRRIREGLALPAFLRPQPAQGPVLRVKGVAKSFGGIQATKCVDLEVRSGQIHALIGPNGAGKTTTFNLISGLYPPDAGSVHLKGEAIHGLPAHRIAGKGLARSFQITSQLNGLTIYENLRLSVQARHPGRFNAWRDIDSYPDIHAETAELIRFLGLEGIEDIRAGDLSYGGQRLVDLGIALACKPQVLLLDEPLAGLAAAERERVSKLVQAISAHVPVLIVEHDIDRVLAFSHVATVMNQGEVLMTGAPEAVRCDRRVQEVYTGTGTPPVTGRASAAAGDEQPVLQLARINAFYGKSHILNDASLDVRRGEIVALLGRNGAGKSTLLKTVAGLVPAASGSIVFDGLDIARLPAFDVARRGIGYVPQGRGLFAGMTVAENLHLGRLARSTAGRDGVVWSEGQVLEMFPALKPRMHTAADYLSGGEQQMLAVARALSGNVRLLLLDEPFEGLAPAVVQELFTVFDKLRRHVPILIVEHNLDLVLALADRAFALERGAVFHEGPAEALLKDLDYRKRILWL